MTLDEFRRRWTPADWSEAPPPAAQPAPQRLMFVPPDEPALVPRLIFREEFTPAAVTHPPRPKVRGLARTLGWALGWGLVGLSTMVALGVGLDKMFEVADGYVETYVFAPD